MRQPIPLRPDHDAARLRRIARESEDADQVRRLLALAVIYDGGSRTEAAEVGGVTLQMVRDWVLRFNAQGPDGLIDRKAPGQPSRAERRAPCRAGGDGRERPDPGRAWRGPLADHRSVPMDLGGIRDQRVEADAEPRAAGDGLSQAVGAPTPSRPGGGCRRGFQKNWPATRGDDRAPAWRRSRRHRGLVRRRSPDRPEEQDHPSLGEARQLGPRLRQTSAPRRPTSSAPSAPRRARPSA